MLVFERAENVLILVHGPQSPTRAEWEGWLQRMRLRDYSSILIATEGGGPTQAQRAAARQFWRDRAWPKFAFVTGSVPVRDALAAFKWIGFAPYRVFATEQLNDALRSIDVVEADLVAVAQMVQRLRQSVQSAQAAASNAS